MKYWKSLLILLAIVVFLGGVGGIAHAESAPVVHAVLFYSPTCPHCHVVINEGLPPIIERYGDQLQIILINVTTQGGNELYQATVAWLNIPPNMQGVPTLVVGEQILVGENDIPQRLPAIVDEGLAHGGIDWPAIPGFSEVLASIATPTPSPDQTTVSPGETQALPALANDTELSPWERASQDVTGSVLAIVVLVGLIASLIWVVFYWARHGLMPEAPRPWQQKLVPALAVIGLGIALYLSVVETTSTQAVCGPVGDCNTVQQSPYARLFGVLPVGVLGAIGYVFMLALWAWQRWGNRAVAYRWAWLLPAATLFGVAFSAYLTFLEPFVIGAVCLWCLSSAVIMAALLWATYRSPLLPPEPTEINTD